VLVLPQPDFTSFLYVFFSEVKCIGPRKWAMWGSQDKGRGITSITAAGCPGDARDSRPAPPAAQLPEHAGW